MGDCEKDARDQALAQDAGPGISPEFSFRSFALGAQDGGADVRSGLELIPMRGMVISWLAEDAFGSLETVGRTMEGAGSPVWIWGALRRALSDLGNRV